MKFHLCSLLFILMLSQASGQSRSVTTYGSDALTNLIKKESQGKVLVTMDSLIMANYNKHLVQNAKDRGIFGHRIRIFSDNGYGAKDNQLRVQAKFLSSFPEIKTYNEYEGSYYKIYVGDFRTRRDALRELEKISLEFPDAFIVEYKIIIEE